jgi:glycosyltransferase involved in cell wall biosynthesis
LLLDFSPIAVSAWAFLWAKRHYHCRSYAYVTDFFPFHHRRAGLNLGGGLGFATALALESTLLRKFETIACMSPAGVDYVKRHYHLRQDQRVRLLHLWGDTRLPPISDARAVRSANALPPDRPIILFGGQITEGRGIEELLEVAAMARQRRPDLLCLFIGSGRLEPLVRTAIDSGQDNVVLRAPVGRDEYLALAGACDIGVVSTVANTGVPSFPSKTIDYLRAVIPIVASVEETTDYSEFIQQNGFGVATRAGEPEAFLSALLEVLDDPSRRERMVTRGRQALTKFFDVTVAARTILDQAFGDE